MGQNSKIALSLYNNNGYKASIPLLEKSADSSIESKEKIANSYRLNHDTKNAEIWYQHIVGETKNPIHYLYYAQALQSNEKYELAQKYFTIYEDSTGDKTFRRQSHTLMMDRKINEGDKVLVQNVSVLNTEKIDFSPAYYKDQIIFISNRYDKGLFKGITDLWTDDNFMAIWSANIKSDGSLSNPVPFSKELTTKYNEGPISVNREGDRMFFTRNDFNKGKRRNNSKGVMKLEIYTSVKKGDGWSKPRSLNFNTAEYDEAHPAISHNGDRLYFSSNREGGFGGMDLYYSDYKNGIWTEPVNLGAGINTTGNDVFPYLHLDGTLYYASNGRLGLGGLDLFQVSINAENEWGQVENMGLPFNSPKDDFGIVLNKSKTEGYFSSARTGGHGKDDIYSFKIDQLKNSPESESISKAEERTDNNSILIVQQTENTDKKKTDDFLDDKKVFNDTNTKLMNSAPVKILGPNTLKKEGVDETKLLQNRKIHSTNESDMLEVPSSSIIVETPNKMIDTNELSNKNDKLTKSNNSIEGAIIELPYIYYDFNSSYLRKEVKKKLDIVVEFMTKHPSIRIELRSHSDSRGSAIYNLNLSQKRAESVVKYIIEQGIAPDRLEANGYGETEVRNQCINLVQCSEEEHQYNRRTEIRIIDFDKTNIEIKNLYSLPLIIDLVDPNR